MIVLEVLQVLTYIYSNSCYFHQEKQLQVNMKINKLRETVKAHQEKVTVLPWDWSVLVSKVGLLLSFAWGFTDIMLCVNYASQLQTVAKTAGLNHEEWLANADRWVAGFLEKFEQHCHNMVICFSKNVILQSYLYWILNLSDNWLVNAFNKWGKITGFQLELSSSTYCTQETAIKDRIQERLGRQLGKGMNAGLVQQQPVVA